MKISQAQYIDNQWNNILATKGFEPAKAQLVLAFGSGPLVTDQDLFGYIRRLYPVASIVSASTAGEIAGETVCDNSIVVTALEFEATGIRCCSTNISEHAGSYSTGSHLMKELSSDGLSAVFIISDGSYDIILMDLQMPVMDGYTASRCIREFDLDTPIIALTASASPDMQQKALDHGMNDSLSKPFNPNDLFETVSKYTRNRAAGTSGRPD